MLQPCNKIFKVTGKSVPGIYLLHICLVRSYFDVHFFTTVPRYVAARLTSAALTEHMKYVWHVLLALTFMYIMYSCYFEWLPNSLTK
jgi:hypothetical protein